MKSTPPHYLKLLVFLSSFFCTSLFGQPADDFSKFDPQFERFKIPIERGPVLKIIQDSTGFLWIASKSGLTRYDGQRYVTFRHDSLNVNTLSNDELEYLYQDRRGVIWIAHIHADLTAQYYGDLTSFDPVLQKFTRYSLNPPDSVLALLDRRWKFFSYTPRYPGCLTNLDSSTQKGLSLGIACIDYRNPAAHKFKYQLQHYESTWQEGLRDGLAPRPAPEVESPAGSFFSS